jgi:hypothetical protein
MCRASSREPLLVVIGSTVPLQEVHRSDSDAKTTKTRYEQPVAAIMCQAPAKVGLVDLICNIVWKDLLYKRPS